MNERDSVMTASPKISIGITTYDRPEFLREAIDSILNQSFRDFEIIVSNDYLDVPVTWDSLGLMEDARVRLVNQTVNLGELRNMNFLLHAARAEWFIWLADDDLLHPEFFLNAIKVINNQSSKKISAVYSNYFAAETPLGIFPEHISKTKLRYFNTIEFTGAYLSRKLPLVGTYGLMRTIFLKEIGGMNRLGNSFSPYSDNLIPLMLVNFGSIAWYEERFVFLRTHSESLSCKSTDVSAFTSAEDDFLMYLNRMFSSVESGFKSERFISTLIAWFASNELAVISRNTELTAWQKISKFMRYQLQHHLPRLSMKYKIFHVGYVVSLVVRYALISLRLRVRGAI
jgi:glycosyltransferase involved in cell wall biosynthesis